MSHLNSQEKQTLVSIQLARYRFHLRAKTPVRLPAYASSTLRGVFGHALRQISCITGAPQCTGCGVITSCPYPRIFEPQKVPLRETGLTAQAKMLAPYAIETPFDGICDHQPGAPLSFDMVLVGDSITQLPLIIAAWRLAFSRGLGNGNGTAELSSVHHVRTEHDSAIIYNESSPIQQPHDSRISIPVFNSAEDVLLSIDTPLRIEHRGALVGAKDISTSIFLRHLIRRVTMQVNAQNGEAYSLETVRELNALADQVQDVTRQLNWHDWKRYSSRQKKEMTLGGLIGTWHLNKVPADLLPIIYLGQWLHAGKEISFGFGKYRWLNQPAIEDNNCTHPVCV